MNTTLPTDALREAADELSRRYAAGELSATDYRDQLAQLRTQGDQVAAGDTAPEVPPAVKHRGPAKRTASSAKAAKRETR